MIRPATDAGFGRNYEIINDAAQAYRDTIPADCWHEPYMPSEELREQIADGVAFLCFGDEDGGVIGVMGIQDRRKVGLIRHAYVATAYVATMSPPSSGAAAAQGCCANGWTLPASPC